MNNRLIPVLCIGVSVLFASLMIYEIMSDQVTHTERVVITDVQTDDGKYTTCRCVEHGMPAGGMWGVYGKVGDTLTVNIRTNAHRIDQ